MTLGEEYEFLNDQEEDPKDQQSVAGCPIAILEKNVTFPILLNTEDPLYVNMMPIDLHDLSHSVPEHCHGYLPLIESCIICLGGSSNSQISYLTVDERPKRGSACGVTRTTAHSCCGHRETGPPSSP